jgi:DNA repair exonuclease SbcCD ATPase subunit
MTTKRRLPTTLTSVKKILHVADIHIRLFKRHQEYRDVFDSLYASFRARDLTDTIIVVAGDVVHSKTDMSPEMVNLASEFLTTLATIAPTIVIPGNHDLNLANPNRMDALTPIINNINNSNLYYLRDSGIYQFADVEFGVHSIIGSPSEWPSPLDMSGTKIALYHAPVNKAQTDVGYNVTSRITVEQFNGYDMVLLGDVHRTQILQEKSVDRPEIAYAGSLIQQNHGESLTGHGYLVWDVPTAKIESAVEIPNSCGYYTLTISDTKTVPNIDDMPKNVRLRMFVGDVDATFIKKVQSVIRKKFNVLECAVNRSSKAKTASSDQDQFDDMHDVKQQNKYISSFVKAHFPNVSDDELERILDINVKLNERIGEDELPKNISWRPLTLKFDNLFSYGADNVVNFDEMSGLYGIFSANATGKTSAFDAMCFALYDKTPRAFKGSHIMNTRKDTFQCELVFEVNGVTYTIVRSGTRKKTGEVKVDVDFYRMDGETKISLNGEDRRDTNATIRSYVGTYEDFILTTLSVQNQNSLFIETGQSDRKDLLSQFIGLTIFDRLFNLASDEIKEVAGALKAFKKDDFSQRLADVQTQLSELELQYDTTVDATEELTRTIDELTSSINALYEKKTPTIQDIDPDPIRHALETNKILLEHTREVIVRMDEESNRLEKAADVADQDWKTQFGDQTAIDARYQKFEMSKAALAKLRASVVKQQTIAHMAQSKLDKLKSHKYDPNCKFCIENVFVKDAERARLEYSDAQTKLTQLEYDIAQGEKFLADHAEDELIYKVSAEEQLKVQDAKNQAVKYKATIELAKRNELTLIAEIEKDELALLQFETNKIAIEQNKTLQLAITEQESQKSELEKLRTKHQSEIRTAHGRLEVLRRQKQDMLQTIAQAEELETTYDAYETYLTVVGRDGLPYELISQVIPTIQSEVNEILSQIVEFTVTLDVDGKNINGRIHYDSERNWPLELGSGMEKFVSGLAIRVALMSISNLPKSNFLVIDEGLGVLDADNLSSMTLLFDVLKNKFDIVILISHLDTARDITDNLIEIERTSDGFSKITV